MLYQTINPYTEEVVETFPSHTDADLESFIAKAEKTYATDWRLRPLAARKAVLKKAASILREKVDEYARPVTLEMGKLFREAQWEVTLSADILDYYAENADKFQGSMQKSTPRGALSITASPSFTGSFSGARNLSALSA
jgi:succinate-semialdehyde dehydrogenase/glutarate-semialdehyde dehydrogenase